MKNAKFAVLLGLGIMTLLAGCFNPVSIMSPGNKQEKDATPPDTQPFPVDIYVGQEARSIVGGSEKQIKYDGLRNFVQLVVLNSKNKIVAYDEVRREKSTDKSAGLQIMDVTYGETYKILLLMGNWERDIAADAPDANNSGSIILGYKEDAYPVLLAAGYVEEQFTGAGIIRVMMWPVVIDTVFQARNSALEVQPITGQPVDLLQTGSWKVKWNIGRNSSSNGLAPLLKAHSAAAELPVIAKKYIVDGVVKGSLTGGTTSHAFEFPLDEYKNITDIGESHGVNFCVEYAPFNKTAITDWIAYDRVSKFDFAVSPPKWIIRNGLNDAIQNSYTDFSKTENPVASDYKLYNGNGGAGFTVKEHKGFTDNNQDGFPDGADDDNGDGFPDSTGTAKADDLILGGGNFRGPAGARDVKIAFGTAGYAGEAAVYYGIAAPGAYSSTRPLPYTLFTGTLGFSFSAGYHNDIPITLPDTDEHDIWLVFMKDGRISNRIVINTRKAAGIVIPIWPCEDGYYVQAGGDDNTGDGSYYAPFGTLDKGISAAVKDSKTSVIVIGALTSVKSKESNSTFAVYDSIAIKGHPGSNAALIAAPNKRVLYIKGAGKKVTLENITLTGGTGNGPLYWYGAGLFIEGATVTLKEGAKITGNGDVKKTSGGGTYRGGGVWVDKWATFVLDGGEISNNWVSASEGGESGGGGIFVEDGTVYLKRGIIRDNYAYNDGGGVAVSGISQASKLYMYEGVEVRDNKAGDDGGGIRIDWKAEFHLYGGTIIRNTAESQGGGLRLEIGKITIYPKGSHPDAGELLIAGQGHPDANAANNDNKTNGRGADYFSGEGGHAYSKWRPDAAWQTTIDNSTLEDASRDKKTFIKDGSVYTDTRPW
jgi:hypothetical protein